MENSQIILKMERLLRDRRSMQRRALAQSCLHIGQPGLLFYIQDHPGCSQKQIADEAGVTPASVATSLKRLEKIGMITRRADTADSRCNRVYLTKAGEEELEYCTSGLIGADDTLNAGITHAEIQAFSAVLDKMIDNLKEP